MVSLCQFTVPVILPLTSFTGACAWVVTAPKNRAKAVKILFIYSNFRPKVSAQYYGNVKRILPQCYEFSFRAALGSTCFVILSCNHLPSAVSLPAHPFPNSYALVQARDAAAVRAASRSFVHCPQAHLSTAKYFNREFALARHDATINKVYKGFARQPRMIPIQR